MLRDLYRESMDNNPRGGGFGGGGLAGLINGPRVQNLNLDANGNPKGVTLTMAVDDKTNSLLLACPTPMYEDIKKLVEQMEIAAGDYKQTVKFVRVPGVDPAVIQQALDAIQGKVTVNRNTTTTTNAMPGGFGGGFPGFGGNRGPGGFGGGFNNPDVHAHRCGRSRPRRRRRWTGRCWWRRSRRRWRWRPRARRGWRWARPWWTAESRA